MSIYFIFVSDNWFSRNRVHHPTMRENHRDARSGLTRQVLYFFFDKKILTRSSMCIEDNMKNYWYFINI